MKKKLLGIIMILCLIISTCSLVACNNTNDPPEGGAWWAQAKVTGGTATLTFTSETEWKLDCKGAFFSDDWNPWQSGTYRFAGEVGKSTLYMTATKQSPNTFIKDKAVGEEASYEPTDGVYTIVFDVNGSDAAFSLKPPQDGTKPGGDSISEPCTNHVDNNCDGVCDNEGCDETVTIAHVDEKNNETGANGADGKCDKCGNNMPSQPSAPTLLLTMNATDAATTMAAELKLYQNNTFDFVLPMMGGKVFGGRWESSDPTGQNPLAPLTLTVDSTGSPVVGETITVTITPAQDYSSMTYTCHVDYVVPETITMDFDFTGTFVINA